MGQAAEDRSGRERAERGSGRGREPARAGSGAESVEVQLARVQTRVDGIETQAGRSDDRWEKWRVENQRQQAESRKEHAELRQEQAGLRQEQAGLRQEQAVFRKEVAEGFRYLSDKIDRQSDKIDRQGQEMTAISRRADEKLELAKVELERRFSRVDLGLLVMLAAILVTGALSVISILN